MVPYRAVPLEQFLEVFDRYAIRPDHRWEACLELKQDIRRYGGGHSVTGSTHVAVGNSLSNNSSNVISSVDVVRLAYCSYHLNNSMWPIGIPVWRIAVLSPSGPAEETMRGCIEEISAQRVTIDGIVRWYELDGRAIP